MAESLSLNNATRQIAHEDILNNKYDRGDRMALIYTVGSHHRELMGNGGEALS